MSLYANLTAKYADPWYPIPRWRRALLSTLAYVLGVQIRMGEYPYGASRDRHRQTTGNGTGYDLEPPTRLGDARLQPASNLVAEALPGTG